MFGGIGIGELLLLFGAVLLLFGAKRLPELGASLGKGIHAFRRGAAGAVVAERWRRAVPRADGRLRATIGESASRGAGGVEDGSTQRGLTA